MQAVDERRFSNGEKDLMNDRFGLKALDEVAVWIG